MLKNEDFLQLRVSYMEIGKMIQKYGYGQYNGVLNIIKGQINCIDSNENDNEKLQYLLESYKRLFTTRGGISDFVFYEADDQLRNQLNNKYNDEVNRLWAILKDYI